MKLIVKQEGNLIIVQIIVRKNPNYHIYNKLGYLFSTQGGNRTHTSEETGF